MSDSVVIAPYNPAWPARFEAERARLADVFRGAPAVIEHIGSTAVPGLAAKPVLDIMVGVSALSVVEARVPELEALGYEYVPDFEAELPERRYFRKQRGGERTHHVHCVVRGGEFWRSHLLFRDYLRGHDGVAAEYHALKLALAARHRSDRAAYTDAKGRFIQAALERAREE